MPYVLLRSDCRVLERPQPGKFDALIADLDKPGLSIFGYPFETLEPLAGLTKLEVLLVQDANRLRSLAGIESLRNLREFVMATAPGSDGSGAFIDIESFKPLATLDRLERGSTLHVRPRDGDIAPFMSMTGLKAIDIADVPAFPVEDYARLAAALPDATGRCLQSDFVIEGVGRCRKCQGQQVFLTGPAPGTRRRLCPACDEKALSRHRARWTIAYEEARRNRIPENS